MTDFVERALKTVAPAEYTSRAVSHQLELVQGLGLLGNEQIAVFICTTAFPYVACPLFVYEPRYRLMIRRCMESGVRQFGIAACLNKEATGAKRCVTRLQFESMKKFGDCNDDVNLKMISLL